VSAALTVEVGRTLDLPAQDAAAVDTLIAARPEVGVFVSRAWLSGFLGEPAQGAEGVRLLLREAGIVRGTAALAVRRARTHVRVSLLGGGMGSDRTDLLAARGYEAPCADALVGWLADTFGRDGYLLALRDVPAESPLWGAVHRANAEGAARLTLQPREVHTLPYLDLDAPDAEAPDAAAVQRARSLDKHRRWLERRGRLQVETLKDPCAVADAFDSLVGFLHGRWRGHAGGSVLDGAGSRRFHAHVIPLLLAEGRLRMVRLTAADRTIGVFYGLAAGSWWGYYLAGYDREWAGRIHLGRLTLALAIEAARQDGAATFDFLKGAEQVKYQWAVRERATVDADVYSAGAGAQLARATSALHDVVAAGARCVRHLVEPYRKR
jgi:CelD/BcsL family acetyltransferase involved in cellulose biosynthesis